LVIDVGRANNRRLVIAWALLIPICLSAIICGVAEVIRGRTGGGLGAVAFGVLVLVLGLVALLVRRRTFLPRQVVIEQAGIRWDDPKGRAWAVRWQELAAVAFTRLEPAVTGLETVRDRVLDAAVERTLGERVLVHLEMYPADPSFHGRRPDLAHLWKKDRLRLQLGFNAHQLPQLDAATRYFAPGRYLGVQPAQAVRRFR
jgi:hypothetical protein